MPINDKYKAVFVRIPKNGGTTVEYLLGMHGELDTVGILPYTNQVKNEFLFGAGSQEFTAKEIKQEIGHEKFSSYTSFCILRNPYSRLISYVAWAKQYRPHATNSMLSIDEFTSEIEKIFKSFEDTGFDNLYLKPQWFYVCDDTQNQMIDHVFKFEKYEKVLDFVSGLINTDVNPNERRMPSNHYNFERYLTPQTLTMINQMYGIDFELFNYPKIL